MVDSADERELWIVGKEHERPPFFHAGKGGDTRLAEALRMCLEDKITPQSDGSYQVHGSGGRVYRVAESCSCPASQHAQSRWCKHAVGVAVYIEWQKRLRPMAPVELGTLRPGTLPLPPVSVDERLAQGASRTLDTVDTTLPHGQEDGDAVTQEDLMAADDADADIPEPDPHAAPTAVLEAPDPAPPAPGKIPREYTITIQGRPHVLYTGLVHAARAQGLVTLAAEWTYNDAELSLAHAVCTFADGRRYEDSGDASPGNVSKGIAKHFRRVALTRAKARCLRDALGISECSVEEMEEPPVPDLTRAPTAQDLRQRIWARVQELAPTCGTRASVAAFVETRTGFALQPSNYQAIAAALEQAWEPPHRSAR